VWPSAAIDSAHEHISKTQPKRRWVVHKRRRIWGELRIVDGIMAELNDAVDGHEK
jgi:hypothetical protein